MESLFKRHMDAHKSALANAAEGLPLIETMARAVAECFLSGGSLFICGSGISLMLIDYVESLFINKCSMARPPLPAIALKYSIGTSMSDPDEIYEKQLTALGSSSDILLAISAEMPFENMLRALRYAAASDLKTIGFSGKDNKTLHGLCDMLYSVDSANRICVTEIHIMLINILCDRVDNIIFNPGNQVK